MERLLMTKLIAWKDNPDKKPLIVRGVRQCGKTYLLQEFGKTFYEDVAYYKFDEDEKLEDFFRPNLNPRRIIKALSLSRGKDIKPGKTLIFFDEIQFCGKALASLKYFCEEAPEYHIVAAGSLLGIALPKKSQNEQNPSFPVGKVSFLTLYPFNFYEFLLAQNELLARHLQESSFDDELLPSFAPELKEKLLEFFVVGGMPKAVKTWIETNSIEQTEEVQQEILDGFEVDFVKHAPPKDFPKLSAIWRSIPSQLSRENRKFIFSHVKESWRAKDLEDALEWLIRAGLIYKVENIEKPFLPISAYANHTIFKLYMCDIGLLRKLSKLPPKVVFDKTPVYREFRGAMAENYVLGELVNIYNSTPYYWTSDTKSGKAEVDFIIQEDADIVPIEVKAGSASHAQSLKQYCQKYQLQKSVLTSLDDNKPNIIPLYLIWKIREWLQDHFCQII
ncbi:MAG: ATP-binding protein [Clostridiales bacterium]|nr:ATP-binding protein [Clostridiales bacterium]